jgi:hypothetical protein
MAHKVFICHSSIDKPIADAVCAALEAQRIPCWIAPRDILAGEEYGKAIIEALGNCQIVLLIFSRHANESPQVRREIERAVSKEKILVPFRIEDVLPSDAMEFALSNTHWLDAITPPMEGRLLELCNTIANLLQRHTVAEPLWKQPEKPPEEPKVEPKAAPLPPPAAIPNQPPPLPPAPPPSNPPWWKTPWAITGLAIVVILVLLSQLSKRNTTGPAAPPPGPDPIVGCYQWYNGAPVAIHSDHTLTGGPFTAQWQVVNAAQRTYSFTWPQPAISLVAVSFNQRGLSGENQYGFTLTGARIAGRSGLVGVWNVFSGVPMTITVNGNGSYSSTTATGTFLGSWQPKYGSPGVYTMTGADLPWDSVTLSADGSRISGADQFGVATSGVRTTPCTIN